MPLIKSASKAAVGENIRRLTAEKFPRQQAIAIALNTQRRAKRAGGGLVPGTMGMGAAIPGFRRGGKGLAAGLRKPVRERTHNSGLIRSTTAGRTDRLPLAVPADSYVIPSDILSGLGQGNTMAGEKVLEQAFGLRGRPAGASLPGPAAGMAGGGKTDHTPILAAGGEYVICPEDVKKIGGGDIKAGHKLLDDFVKRIRAHTIRTLKRLPGPAR